MKLKKLFAGIVAAAMMATMGVTSVFAEQIVVDKAQSGNSDIKIQKKYTLEGVGTSPAETFTFTATIKPEMGTDGAQNKTPTGTPTISSAAYTTEDAAKTDGNFKDLTVDFSGVTYTNVGRYYYVLSEAAGATAGVTYAPSIGMKVTVGNKSDDGNELEIKTVSFWRLDSEGNFTTKITGKGDEAAFENKYSANTLTITKKTKGDLGDKNQFFKFTLKLTDNSGKTFATNYAITYSDTYAENAQQIVVNGDKVIFYLKNNGTATIANLPANVKWEVAEDGVTLDAEDSKYKTADKKYEVTMTGSEGTIKSTTTANTDNNALFVNGSTEHVDTGIILDNAPYIALLTIVAAGAVVMIMKKRRNYED